MSIENDNLQVITFGCRLNFSETEVIEQQLKTQNTNGYAIFNTCSVTLEAERKARQAIRKLKKDRPNLKILVTGCAAQISPEKWSSMPEVNYVIGNKEKIDNQFWKKFFAENNNQHENIVVSDIMKLKETSHHLLSSFDNKTRCFLQIQNGCNHRCTFCIIPFGRGNSRSVHIKHILENIRIAIANGVKEIILTGVDLTSWGNDFTEKQSLGLLLKKIFKQFPNIPRLRISSIDPAEIDHDFMDVIQDQENFMPHLHLSLQHGDDLILKRMKRRHLYRDVINFVNEAKRRRSDIILGADFISGFPTETEKAHRNTLRLIDEADIKYAHIFPFSPRIGTPAYKLPTLTKKIIDERSRELRELGKEMKLKFLKTLIGTKQRILVEKNFSGYTPQFAKVNFCEDFVPGKIINVNIAGIDGINLIGNS